MRTLKIQFACFLLFLCAVFAAGLIYTHHRLDAEEAVLWERLAEGIFNQVQAEISEHLANEDTRSFSEYRYYFVPEGQVPATKNLSVSPLAALPKDDPSGLIGYFQIDPDGSFHSPYLPPSGKTLSDLVARRVLHDRMKAITQSFQKNVREDYRNRLGDLIKQENAKLLKASGVLAADKTVELDTAQKITSSVPAKEQNEDEENKIYPNPLRERTEKKSKSKKDSSAKANSSKTVPSSGGSKSYSRKITNDPVQSQAFEVQNADAGGEDDITGNSVQSMKSEPSFGRRRSTPMDLAADDSSSTSASIFIDPFRARLVGESILVFYRKVWLGQRLYLQGFAVDLATYFESLMDRGFAGSELASFAVAELLLEDQVLQHTPHNLKQTSVLFARALGYPLNLFTWQVRAGPTPAFAARRMINVISIAAAVFAAGALYFIYRSVQAEVFLARKRQDFVSAVTHELKTPLTAIRMYSEMLEQNWVQDDHKRSEYYASLSREGARLSRLIDNVLQLSSLEKGTLRIKAETRDPRGDFVQVAGELAPLVERAGLRLLTRVTGEMVPVIYDAEAIKQIFFTLLDNSLKFANEGKRPEIEMSLVRAGETVVWALRDYGPGVPEAELPRIFDTFYRVESEMTRKTKGSGIGLAMARMLANAMGATIEANNAADGGLIVRLIFVPINLNGDATIE